jgi:SAM-dependent methyltransferase
MLSKRAGRKGLANIETVLGLPDDPKMPIGIFDMIFMHATIHFIDKPVELFNALLPGLKPNGKIVVIEPEKPDIPTFH